MLVSISTLDGSYGAGTEQDVEPGIGKQWIANDWAKAVAGKPAPASAKTPPKPPAKKAARKRARKKT